MTIGIVGLGLIGGSLARAWKAHTDHTVLGWDRDESVTAFAELCGAIDGVLTPQRLAECELIMPALYPQATIDYLRENGTYIAKDAWVIDCAGTKRTVCEACFPLAAQYGFCFVGGHPMAGTHNSGFKYSRANLFHNAPMVLVPPRFDDIAFLDRIETLLRPLSFASFCVTTAEKHDEMIAFTSQMAHLVSNAYIKSPAAQNHKGFSAGSYKDMTRVAWLNPDMWSQLFLENGDFLLQELDGFIQNLQEYRDALAQRDAPRLRTLLDEGRKRKEEVDGR